MPKKIKLESFKYRFLIAAEQGRFDVVATNIPPWNVFVCGLNFAYQRGSVTVSWAGARPGKIYLPLDKVEFYRRGDNERYQTEQVQAGLLGAEDPVKLKNDVYFRGAVKQVAESAGFRFAERAIDHVGRLTKEREFHDAWAHSEDLDRIDVFAVNEACTAPEIRYIKARLGNLRGKRLLDVGCGLGEASVYFAMLGANVTSTDLSQGMLDATSALAERYHVKVTPHLATAEDLKFSADALYDVIYAGNLMHHVDIEQTLTCLKPHLATDGLFVTWDPLAYNPVINIYRAIATDVRTPDEHPLKWKDIRSYRKHFGTVETRYFWLSTLIIFVILALVQRRNPNKERFWKIVVEESEKWKWLYTPLERIDRALLWLLPPIRLLCWNVVIVARR